MRAFLTAAATVGVCGALRQHLEKTLPPEGRDPEPRIRLKLLWNEHGAFGLKIPQRVLTAVSAGALLTVWLQRRHAEVSAGLILGGGVSNLLERLRQGKVCDYIQFPKAPGTLKRYVFNLADFAVFFGVLGMLFSKRK